MRPTHTARLVLFCGFTLSQQALATESDVLFFLNKLNPLSVTSAFDPVSSSDTSGTNPFFKKTFMRIEGFNQIDIAPSLVLRQHIARLIADTDASTLAPFAAITVLRAYEPTNPYDRLRLKNNHPVTQTDTYGIASGLQSNEGHRWWSFALGFDQIRKRDYTTKIVSEKRQALAAQYVLFDRSFAPYVVSVFTGIDGGTGGIYARLTPYITTQDGLLVGPDLHLYHDSTSHKVKIGAALAGMHYQKYELMLASGYEQDRMGQHGVYFSFGMAHKF